MNRINEGDGEGPIKEIDFCLMHVCRSTCKIKASNITGSGFFLQLFNGNNPFYCLLTCEHVVNEKMVESKETIYVYYENGRRMNKIKLDENKRYIRNYKNIKIDVTLIQIISEDDINKDYFLIPDLDYINEYDKVKDRESYISQFPLGELRYSEGKITEINNNEFCHSASTRKGSSGSPIFLKDSTQVIGIHASYAEERNVNIGYFIGPIVNSIQETYITIHYSDNEIHEGEVVNGKREGKRKYINEKQENGICKIIASNITGSGFFLQLFSGNNPFYCLLTNEHVVNEKMVESKKSIYVDYENGGKRIEIKLDENKRYIKIYKNINIDVTLIQIISEDDINKDYFLLADLDYINEYDKVKDREIYIPQFPTGRLGYSEGIIIEINSNEFSHLESKDEVSSGSPIFLKDSTQVIGIHAYEKEKDVNIGYFIGHIVKSIKETYLTINYPNGEIYEGEVVNGKREGKGKYIYEKIGIGYCEYYHYVGEWKNDKKNGKGIEYYRDGTIKYEGDFVDDKYGGKGTYIRGDNTYYIGEFKNGKKQGKGTLYNKDGSIKYEGDFIDDQFEGKGKYIWEDGKYYIGECKNNKKNGKGELFKKDGTILYKGDFKDDQFEGEGLYIYEDGKYYHGEWKNDKKHGKGRMYNRDGNILYQGYFENGELRKECPIY